MLRVYKQYKEWWIMWEGDYYLDIHWDLFDYKVSPEQGFEYYWNNLSSYTQFETLLNWVEENEIPEGN